MNKHLPFVYVISLIISISHANAQETAKEQDNTRVSVYLHPFSLIYSPIVYDPLAIYSTVEIPLSLSNSLIVRPSLRYRDRPLNERGYLFRLGSDIGLRHFWFKKGEGLYLQAAFGAYYNNSKIYSSTLGRQFEKKGLITDLYGYLGYSWKFSGINIFADIGFGFSDFDVDGKPNIDYEGTPSNDPHPDFNIGIGIPFGASKVPKKELEKQEHANTRVSVYLHPLWLLFSGLMSNPSSESENEEAMVLYAIYSTIEIPFSLSNSLIIRPSFLREKSSKRNLLRLGSDIGMRHYLSGKGAGWYLQGQLGLFYHFGSHIYFGEDNCDEFCSPDNRKSLWLDAMGYLGYSWKFSKASIFVDAGYGAAARVFAIGEASNFPLPDINLGIGIPF
ncbi:MAG: hypothetical protein FWH22_02395 [Fibromonadales bacterium]|nr:hypothetical protein [Fibromonadales bacterium]